MAAALRVRHRPPRVGGNGGIRLAAYRFDKYRTKEKPEKKPSVASVRISVGDVKAANKAFKTLSSLADAIILASVCL